MRQSRQNRHGFIYSPNSEASRFHSGKSGDIIRIESAPPWLVVDHSKYTVVMTNWPGILWAAEVIEPAPESDQANYFYTRCRAIRLLERTTTTELFGDAGHEVEQILDEAAHLTLVRLVNVQPADPLVEQLYSDAWNYWANGQQQGKAATDDFRYTLAMGTRDNESPIGKGFLLLSSVFHKHARELEGDAAFIIDDEGNTLFVPKWEHAFDAARHAAMAKGFPHYLSTEDRAKMTASWNNIVTTQ